MQQFKAAFKKAISETNKFFDTEWSAYKAKTENIQIPPFKETIIYTIDE
jgi:hypothetical protein